MDERVKFVARHLEGEKIAVLCREFGISRKTGYTIIERYEETGLEGLTGPIEIGNDKVTRKSLP